MSRTFFKNFFFIYRITNPSLHQLWCQSFSKVQWPPAFLSNENEKPELAKPAGVWYQLLRCRGVGLNEERENEKREFETRKRPPKVNPVADKEAKNTKWGFAYNLLIRIGSASFFSQRLLAVTLLSQRGSVSRTIFHQLPPELWPGQGRYGVRCLVNENEGTRKRGWGRGIHATGHSVKFQ